MVFIPQEKLNEILGKAPQGTTQEGIIKALQFRGHEVENYPTQQKTSLFGTRTQIAPFMSRVGQRLIERRAQVDDILSPRFMEGAEGTFGGKAAQAFSIVGKGAGLATDIGFELLRTVGNTLAPLVPEKAKVGFQEGLQKAMEGSGLTEFLRQHEEAKKVSPEYARKAAVIEGVLNLGGLALEFEGVGQGSKIAARGGRILAEEAGEMAGRAGRAIGEGLEKKASKEVLDMAREPMWVQSAQREAVREGRATTKRGGVLEFEPSKRDFELGRVSEAVIDTKLPPAENAKLIRENIAQRTNNIREAMRKNPGIFNEAELRSHLSATKEGSRVVFGTDRTLESAYDAVVDEFLRIIKDKPHTFEGLFDARIEFDQVMRRKFPRAFEELGDNARYNAVRDVRTAANDFIAERMPGGESFKGILRDENLLYDVLDNVSAKAVHEQTKGIIGAANKVVEIFQKNPIQLGGAIAVGIGALTGILSSPVAIGAIIATGAYKLGKKVITSEILQKGLQKSLEGMERLLKTSNPAKRVVIEADIEVIKDFMNKLKNPKIGLSIEDVSKKAAGAAATPESALTTKFLEYAKGKTVLSRQEILDFARRPELKKGEADLLLRKLEEFGGDDVLSQEARKYKSAEEFVKAQPAVYHGSPVPLKSFSNKKGGVFFY